MKYAALLRGINVSGVRIKMDDLATVFTGLGLRNITTYLASGNVIFETDDPEDIQANIEAAIAKHLGRNVRVLVKTKLQLQQAFTDNPFTHEKAEPDRTLFVSFLFDVLTPAATVKFEALGQPQERIKVVGDRVYTLRVSQGFNNSVMGKNILFRRFKADSTTRNWNTLTNLIARMESTAG